jgi:8-oxo-dGTP diphosphatase
VLIRPDGQFLLTSAHLAKFWGYWEFPGGKLEAGEVCGRRPGGVHEELGITIGAVQPWQVELVDYRMPWVRLS